MVWNTRIVTICVVSHQFDDNSPIEILRARLSIPAIKIESIVKSHGPGLVRLPPGQEREEALRLARAAGFEIDAESGHTGFETSYGLSHFAKLITIARVGL